MGHPSFLSGQWNAICDVCGIEYKSGQLRKRWDGLIVCEYDFEQRHPQDLIRIRSETPSIPWSRPEGSDIFRELVAISDSVSIVSPVEQNYVDASYFLEDYIQMNFELLVGWNRTFTETVLSADVHAMDIVKTVPETLSMGDSITVTVSFSRAVSDAVSASDTGSALLFDYVDFTYFSEDYVGTTTSFT